MMIGQDNYHDDRPRLVGAHHWECGSKLGARASSVPTTSPPSPSSSPLSPSSSPPSSATRSPLPSTSSPSPSPTQYDFGCNPPKKRVTDFFLVTFDSPLGPKRYETKVCQNTHDRAAAISKVHINRQSFHIPANPELLT